MTVSTTAAWLNELISLYLIIYTHTNMKQNKLYTCVLSLALLAGILSSCQDEDTFGAKTPAQMPITLSGEIEQLAISRVNDNGFCDGDEMGVYIVDYVNGEPGELLVAGNRATNVKFTFDEAATFLSYDKDTRNNKGLMVNQDYESSHMGTPKFEMQELPQEIGKIVYEMEVGDISKPFTMLTDKQKEVVAIVKLRARVEGHKANLADDYQALKSIVEARKKEELLNDWIIEKQRTTYVRISEGWRNCDFKYPGWVKE